MAYRVETATVGGRKVHSLHDDGTGASASVLPSFGFNLFDLRLPVAGRVRPMVASAEGWAANPSQPGRNGTPILFPFPNRIALGKFAFQGKAYEVPVNSGPNAIHGFAIQAPWEVVEHQADDTGAYLAGRYRISDQSPEMLGHWPGDAILGVRYGLSHGKLSLEATVENPGQGDLPYGFGIHPYFHLPFDPSGDPARTRVILPASESWVLDADLIPTGERRPVDDRLDFRRGQPIRGLKLDDVLTGLGDGPDRAARLVDENLGAEFRMTFDRAFRELVVFTPPGDGRVIAIEPYTQATDAINLHARGIDAGLRILPPGGRETLRIAMEARA